MSEYPKVIERPYKVFTGAADYYEHTFVDETLNYVEEMGVEWTHERSFRLESDAEAYSERIAEEYEFVKIEKKESE